MQEIMQAFAHAESNPSASAGLDEVLDRALEKQNEAAFERFNTQVLASKQACASSSSVHAKPHCSPAQALVACAYCGRTFLPEKLEIHNRSCTPEHPAKPPPYVFSQHNREACGTLVTPPCTTAPEVVAPHHR